MPFLPRFCPNPSCPSHRGQPFRFHRRGTFRRACDGQSVPRFQCLTCRKGFSRQTFCVNYYLKRPELDVRAAWSFVSKTTLRQAARSLGCRRETVELRLRRFGFQGWAYHARQLVRIIERGGLEGAFQLDELETFEADRRLKPVTVPVLIHQESRLMLHAAAGQLPARGNLTGEHAQRRKLKGRRRPNESKRVVRSSLLVLRALVRDTRRCTLRTDEKPLYGALLRELELPLRHETTLSTVRRDTRNPLFPINHTLGMLRDGVSRLVRRSWGASKKRQRLTLHLGMYIAWRNYVRRRFNRDGETESPGKLVGVQARALGMEELLSWRVFPWRLGCGGGLALLGLEG
jgi:transposase-like protein